MSELYSQEATIHLSAGEILRNAREAAGIHITVLAVSLKVPVWKIEALEQDRYDLLLDVVFVRALASSVCRILKLNPSEVLTRLPQISKPELANTSVSLNTPFRPSSERSGPSLWAQVSRPAVIAGLVLLLGALVLILLPGLQTEMSKRVSLVNQSTATRPEYPVTDLSVSSASAPTFSIQPVVDSSQPSTGLPPTASMTGTLENTISTISAAAKSALTSTTAVMASSGVEQTNASATNLADAVNTSTTNFDNLMIFKAKGESWVEVKDVKGVIVLRRTLSDGDTATASGALPLTAIVGRADAMQVQVRGQILDLSKVSRDNVARFEVK